MSEEATAVLADFAASLTYEAIPERVRDYCRDLLLDALACAVAGDAGEETHQLPALSSALAQSRESTVIGGDRLSLRTYASPRLSQPQIDDVIGAVARLEHQASVCTLMDMLRATPQSAAGAPIPVAALAGV